MQVIEKIMSYCVNGKPEVSFKVEKCSTLQNDIVQAVIIVICLQSICKVIQRSIEIQKKTCTCRKNVYLDKVYAIFICRF